MLPPTGEEQQDRQLTALRKRLTHLRTKAINRVQHILMRHNLQQECPTKGIQTLKVKKWLSELELDRMDRLELNQLLAQLQRYSYMKQWYQRAKKRRGSKIARVAVMRRLAEIIWHMVKYKQAYVTGGPEA